MIMLGSKSFDLFIGRQRTRITEPSHLAVDQVVETIFYADMPETVVVAQTYKLFIGEKLFASVRIPAKRPYSRSPITVKKPKRGPLQVHFIKKYVTLHAEDHKQ